jgi:hypothetical protein
LKGHNFSRGEKTANNRWALQHAKKTQSGGKPGIYPVGRGFIPGKGPMESTWALQAAENSSEEA